MIIIYFHSSIKKK